MLLKKESSEMRVLSLSKIIMIIYTDGSCRANKVGGIGLVWIKDDKVVKEYSKRFENVTNNIMELTAIKAALLSIKKPIKDLTIVSDSQYSIGVLTNPSWNPKKNVELIRSIKELIKKVQELVETPIEWKHVRGHQNNEFNNLADRLATRASEL